MSDQNNYFAEPWLFISKEMAQADAVMMNIDPVCSRSIFDIAGFVKFL